MSQRINICFHGIGVPRRALEPGEGRYWITSDSFLRILDEVAGRDVAISFDDGNLSDVEIGLPALRERDLRATFFIVAGRLTESGSLDAEHVRELVSAGMDIGTHGMRHIPWRRLDVRTQHEELVGARNLLRGLAAGTVDQAALPLGRYDRRLLHTLRRLDYRKVFTSDRQWARPSAWLQPRFSVRVDDTVESLRREMLTPPPLATHLGGEMKGIIKRWR